MDHSTRPFLRLFAGLDYFYDDHKENKLNNRRATAYLTKCDQFMTLLAAAVHLSSGQPARATELETMTITNGVRARSLFFSQGSLRSFQVSWLCLARTFFFFFFFFFSLFHRNRDVVAAVQQVQKSDRHGGCHLSLSPRRVVDPPCYLCWLCASCPSDVGICPQPRWCS